MSRRGRPALAAAVVLTGYLAGRGASEWTGAALAAIAQAPIYVAVVVAAVVAATRLAPELRLVWSALGRSSDPARRLAAGVLLSAAVVGAVFAIELAAGWIEVVRARPGGRLLAGIAEYFLLYAVIAFNEELVFRGALLAILDRLGGRAAGVLGSSAVFAAVHIGGLATWQRLLGVLLLGVVLAELYLLTRSLWLPIAFHWGIHALSFAALLGVPPVRLVVTGPVGLTGTADQLDAGWVTIAALALLAIALTRRRASRVLVAEV